MKFIRSLVFFGTKACFIAVMTYYSDLLLVIGEIEALECGQRPSRSADELRALCKNMLAVAPDEILAQQLIEMLDRLPPNVQQDALLTFLVEGVRAMFRRKRKGAF